MLTKLTIRNFKKIDYAEIELGKSVVFIGPNNSGKTTALQSLALWAVGFGAWRAKRGDKASPEKRPGVAINRRDLITIPVPAANLLWRELHTRNVQRVDGKQKTANIRIDVILEGISESQSWNCGFEFDYTNEESLICRPVRLQGHEHVDVSKAGFTDIPKQAESVSVAFLPPMSGLSDREHLKQAGEIGFLIGQGRTAEVLRNLCWQVFKLEDKAPWRDIVDRLGELFGVKLLDPMFVPERSEIVMHYEERSTRLDLASAGRGLQQTLLLLAHLYANPKTVLLLDEPDAHLEVLRQRQIYQLLTDVAENQGSQIVAASHSEVVLNEAAGRGKVISFVGKPHTINDRGSQLLKSLTDIGWEQYYQAEVKGWLLCVEGSSDLAILRTFAERLGHPARTCLESPFVHYVSTNLPQKARDFFRGLKEAKPDLVGIALFDRIDAPLHQQDDFLERMWSQREFENYLCRRDVLMAYAKGVSADDLFAFAERPLREEAMAQAIDEVVQALRTLDKPDPWGPDIKASNDFLDPVFKAYFLKLNQPLSFRKADYHHLAALVPVNEIVPEIAARLDDIVAVAQKATPVS